MLILFLNSMWGSYPSVAADVGACPLTFSTDLADIDRADVVVVHLPTAPSWATSLRRPGQVWVAFSLESEVSDPLLADASVLSRYDLEMSYRRGADVWWPYLRPSMLAELLTPPQPKTEPFPVARFQSARYDRSGRNAYAAELVRRIKVASYGTVLPTVPRAGTIATREERLATAARHKFTLAFENSIATDYVSEKIFDAWTAGSVPVYLGAPNVSAFAPAARCYIDVADFDSPAELARYLNHLDGNDDDYQEYLEWKRTGVDDRFLELLAAVPEHKFCRLAELARERVGGRG